MRRWCRTTEVVCVSKRWAISRWIGIEQLEERRLLSAAAPTGLEASGGSASTISLRWDASPDPAVTGYDVFEVRQVSNGGGKGSHGGHTVYTAVGTDLVDPSEIVSGLAAGTFYSYVVTAVDASGESPYSTSVTAETWISPSLPYGSAILLSSGALYSSPVAATAGETTQITILGGGNPLNYSVQSGPSSVSIDPRSGVVTYTPSAMEVGTSSITFRISNPLGAVTQTVEFDVAPSNVNLNKPTLKLSGTSMVYSGQTVGISAEALGADGMTPVGGTFAFAYDGSTGVPVNVGKYTVLATFTSSDPNYANATLLGSMTIAKATPAFTQLSAETFASGTRSITFSGQISAGPANPAGGSVIITLKHVSQVATIGTNGNFSMTFSAKKLAIGKYTVTYTFAGNASFTAASPAASRLRIIAGAAPKIRRNPKSVLTTAGDGATFTALASGSNPPTVQWQVSTDGGAIYTDLFSPGGNTLTLTTTTLSQSGDLYRAIFTNSLGTAITSAARLTVQADTGGSD